MNRVRRSSDEWFHIWDGIMLLEDALSRISLSEKSGASIWIIKSLQQDWMQQNDIVWDRRMFSHYKPQTISLSLFLPASEQDKERMK